TPQNNADIEHNEFISDTANWILIEGWFTADSMYNWLAIGNFYDDQQTNTIELGWEDHCCAIYYIDNVCVTKNPTDCDYLLSVKDENENKIKVIPNPFIGELKLNFLSQQIK